MATMLLCTVIVTSILLTCGAQEYYVTPTPPPNTNCPSDKPCETLDYYARNTSLLSNHYNVSLIFLEGYHQTTQFFNAYGTNILNVTGSGNRERVIIFCPHFHLEATHNLIVRSLSFNFSIVEFNTRREAEGSQNRAIFLQKLIFQDSLLAIREVTKNNPYTNTVVELMEIQTKAEVRNEQMIYIYTDHMTFNFSKCVFQQPLKIWHFWLTERQGNVLIQDSVFKGISEFPALELDKNYFTFNNLLSLNNVTFSGNKITPITIDHQVHMIIQNCKFINNTGIVSGAISANNSSLLFMENNLFLNNVGRTGGAIHLSNSVDTVIENCKFVNNSGIDGGAISATNSSLLFIGDNLFLNNVARTGGALHLSNSTMKLGKNLTIKFRENKAEQIGGAIFLEPSCEQGSCFYSLTFDLPTPLPDSIPVSIVFDNNTAMSGSDIYGAGLQNDCEITPNKTAKSCNIQKSIFVFLTPTSTSVTTSPARVCICENNEPNCANIEYIFHNRSAAAGERFNISVALVGENFAPIAGSVYASSTNESDFSFNANHRLQLVESHEECTTLEYSIQPGHEKIKTVSFILSTDIRAASGNQKYLDDPENFWNYLNNAIQEYNSSGCINDILQKAPAVINVTIIPCPEGLKLSDKRICECDSSLNNYITNCSTNNNNGLFHRDKNVWIGPTDSDNSSNSTISVYSSCPFDYCNYDTLDVELSDPDSQCAFNRSGVLCGGCAEGLSLSLGSSKCLDCKDNWNIAWILLFVVGGIVLVLFIKVLDLTVSHGTINGLIFYANVVWINQGTFFSNLYGHDNEILSNLFDIMKGFIAWLNLDFGIDICLFDGLDAYWKTWIQFGYTFYLWLLAGLIVVVCRYSVRATRLLGKNPVSVLCTIILLSYVKLLRTIVDSLSMAILTQINPDGVKWVWLMDGNIPYLGLKQAILFAAALLVLLFLWLPYTFALLFVRQLKMLPCGLSRFAVRLIPFFDSYTGPLKIKHHYWVGLSLLARVGLAIIVLVSQAVNPSLSIAMLCITTSIFCALVTNVYKNLSIMFLELIFLLNVVCLCIAFLAFETVEAKTISICTSSLVCLLIFIGILSFHIYRTVKEWLSVCYPKNGYQNLDTTSQLQNTFETKERTRAPSTTVFFREDLLSNTDI